MLRLALSLIIMITLSACQSDQENTPEIQKEQEILIPEEVVPEFEPHSLFAAQNTSSQTADNCTSIEPLYLTDRIEDLNALSQQMFALDNIGGVNGYANFITLAQLALTSNAHTSDLIEQLGLSGITENDEWLNVFCYLENITPTNELSATIAEDWLIRDDLYDALVQKFQANFTSRSIDPEKDLWRLSLDNSWEVELQLTVDKEVPKYVSYQNTADAQHEIAHAIKITDNIRSVSNEFGDYFSITNDSDYTLHIIMPTFAQYPYVKSSVVDVLNGFKALEKKTLTELYLPYFDEIKSEENFMSFSGWLKESSVESIFDDESQDFSGINQFETFKLINRYNYNSFELNAEGHITAESSNSIDVKALYYVEQSFSGFSSVGFFITHDGDITFKKCEKVEAESTWRPYFIIIENTKHNLIYTIVANGKPEIKDEDSICVVVVDEEIEVF
ncbi:hypothetical protein [Colwellia sp. UCD-KL20]|uniref:hypothetical protein n=1 Tax=Colwellia sp. UCD-KL20 TaxID=1917165 RepID=UPI000970A449|nr:hypothetical protein [Colwellia sp. UCD-KL20]